jgi:regulator of nucleoside diphosphate kinase
MRDGPIVITRPDAARLSELLGSRGRAKRDLPHLEELAEELERALIAEVDEIPADLITIRTRIEVLDLVSGKRRDLALVLPHEADATVGRISVLAPLGTALLGYRAGDEIEWRMPGGWRRLRIESVRPLADRWTPSREAHATAPA